MMKRIVSSRVSARLFVVRHLFWLLFVFALVLPVSQISGLRSSSAEENRLWVRMNTPYGLTFAYPKTWMALPGAVVDPYVPMWEMRVVAPVDHYLSLVVTAQPETAQVGGGQENGIVQKPEEMIIAGNPATVIRDDRERRVTFAADGFRYVLSIQEYGDVPEHQVTDGVAKLELQASSIEVFKEFLASVVMAEPTACLLYTSRCV